MYIRVRCALRPSHPLTATLTTTPIQPIESSNSKPNSVSNMGLDMQSSQEGTSGVDDVPESSQQYPSILEELERDDFVIDDDSTVIYSYYSTVSTNYTMSNLEGPGRILGNLYSKAGYVLERRLAQRAQQRAHRSAVEAYSRALSLLRERGTIGSMIRSTDRTENEKACEALLICAQYVSSIFVLSCFGDT